MGIVYALLGAASFALSTVLIRRGQRVYTGDDGAVMTGLTNVIILGIASAVIALQGTVVWNWQGFGILILAGVLTTGLGRLSSMAAVRAMGPSRATLFKVSAPLFTLAVAYFFLQERLQPMETVGAAVVLAGLWLLTTERHEQQKAMAAGGAQPGEAAASAEASGALATGPSAPGEPVPPAPGGGLGSTGVIEPSAGPRSTAGTLAAPNGEGGAVRFPFASKLGLSDGAVFGLIGAMCFGTGFVARKWGLTLMPYAIIGAFIGACAGVATSFGAAWARRGWRRTLHDAVLGVPVWFVLAGVAGCMALIGQFSALNYLSATMVSVFFATEPLWALAYGFVLFPGQETVTLRVVLSSIIIMGGVVLIVGS